MTSSKRPQGVAQLAWDHASWIGGLSSLDFPIPLPLGPNLLIQQGFFFFLTKKKKKKKKRKISSQDSIISLGEDFLSPSSYLTHRLCCII